MPAQTASPATAYYMEGDTNPPLLRQLLDGQDNPIDLTDAAAVAIRIAHARYSHYYSPYEPIIDWDACDIPDSVAAPKEDGWVSWPPAVGELSPPGSYHFVYRITWTDGTEQTVPNNTYETMIIRTLPGGPD